MNLFSIFSRRWIGALTLVMATSISLSACAQNAVTTADERVTIARVPGGGLQPEVVVAGDIVHLTYFKGNPKAGDIFYVRSADEGATWTAPLRVNSRPGSAVAMGTIRGAMLAVGRNNRVFVAWNGSDKATPRNAAAPASLREYGAAPLLFTRLNDAGDAFEAQRNLMTRTFNLDGGASVAADDEGRVYVAFHANDREGQEENARRVYLAASDDDGATFSGEKPVWSAPTGACSCCQVGVKAQNGGRVALLYRSATDMEHRDTYFLQSSDAGKSFQGQKVSEWNINSCPMSSFSLAESGKNGVIGWETEKKVYFSRLDAADQPTSVVEAPGDSENRKYPSLAVNKDGNVLFAWTQGTSWGNGGSLCYQLFNAKNQPQGEIGEQNGVPAWSFATAFARPDGGFTVLY